MEANQNTPKKRGRKKGSTSFVEMTLGELAAIFDQDDKIKVSKIQIDALKAALESPKATDQVDSKQTTLPEDDGF
jgi:hypothetical protein